MIKTTDLYLGAAIIASGGLLLNTNRSDPRHIEFSFDSPKESSLNLTDLLQQWASNTLMVSAVGYKEAIQRLKSLIHSG
jgi:hypothetical protein